jgi:diguanylate cyclase
LDQLDEDPERARCVHARAAACLEDDREFPSALEHWAAAGRHRETLRLLSEVMQQSVKGRDIAARFGGEEFAIILPATPLQHAKGLGNAIREKISKKTIVNRVTGLELGQITLSIGAGQYRPGEPPAELIERADAALYRAKKSGRNKVITELENPEPELALGR